MHLARRRFLKQLAGGTALALVGAPYGRANEISEASLLGEPLPFSRAALTERAIALSRAPFEDRSGLVPKELLAMSYDGYRAMRHGPSFPLALAETHFHFEPLLSGFVYRQPVDVFVVSGETARPIVFLRDMYVFDPPADEEVPGEGAIPFSGVRLRTDINSQGVLDEFAVIQGASYFRAIGAGETYGLSARGLAIDTGSPTGEEFPLFRELYLEEPQADAKAVVIHALLDSPSTTGVYRITIRPGDATVTDVELTLYPRRDIETIGFAPFSSMFLFDSVNRDAFSDYRNAVHDSDGLSIHTGAGEWLWRPLCNPVRLEVSAFLDATPRGFGLVQRKRRYSDFQDAEARYESRPTAWVEPIGEWGNGAVVLFEIPTREETNDNIVAYWQPGEPVLAGEPYTLTYRIHWDGGAPARADGPHIIATRVGRNMQDTHELFVIDYAIGERDPAGAQVNIEASAGKARNITIYPTPETGILRVSFELDPDANPVVELRAALTFENTPPAENWVFRWTA